MNDLVLSSGSLIRSYEDLMNISDMLLKSKMLPNTITSKEAVAAVILKGREIGMPMMESFSLINVIQGKPTIAPQGMIALARRTRELEDLQITDDGKTCTVTVRRKGQTPYTSTFSMDDAADMGLAGKDNWRKQPKVMRQWRAIAANFRITFPDVIGGMYTPEELGATVNEDGEVIDSVTVQAPEPKPVDVVMVEPVLDPTTIDAIQSMTASAPVIPSVADKESFFAKARSSGMTKEAARIANAHTHGKVTDWTAALQELGALMPA